MQQKRILLVNPLPSLSLYSWPEVGDVTGHPAYIMNIAPPTLAALGPVGQLEDFDRLKTRLAA